MTRSSQPSQPQVPPDGHATDGVYRGVEAALEAHDAPHGADDVTLRRVDRLTGGDLVRLRLRDGNGARVTVDVTATPYGGERYKIRCTVADGASKGFSYNLPAGQGVGASTAFQLGQKLAPLLLAELDRRSGSASPSTDGSVAQNPG